MIAQAEHKDTIINRQGKTKDIMQAVVDCYNSDYAQVQELADNLPGNDTLSRCRAVFDFVDKTSSTRSTLCKSNGSEPRRGYGAMARGIARAFRSSFARAFGAWVFLTCSGSLPMKATAILRTSTR